MAPTSRLYRTLVATLVPLVPTVLRESRQRAAHMARLGAPVRLINWARQHRDRKRPLAWFHASSVGEGLQARAVLDAYKAMHPETQLIYTHYSPSAEEFAKGIAADFADYLPYDRPSDLDPVLEALAPDLLVFTKLDLWPELATRAAARGTRVAMVAATVSPKSGRLKWPARRVTEAGYQALTVAGAVSGADASRLERLGCRADRITVTGDPRIDSVLAVVDNTAADDPLRTLTDPAMTLVAGSTWPLDEAVILLAFESIYKTFPQARLILVPHDPSVKRLYDIEQRIPRHHLPKSVRLSALHPEDKPAIILVDQVGLLSRLYATGEIAYVGGGWGRSGIHSVLEPAAWGRPVFIGPHDRESRDATLLSLAGALHRIPLSKPGFLSLRTSWEKLLNEGDVRRREGASAKAALEAERGAAKRSAELL